MAKYPKKSAAAKERAARQPRIGGRFSVSEKISTAPITGDEVTAPLPPNAHAIISSMFVVPPNPVNDVFYNPDEAFLSNPENASRMIQDMAIYSALQERQLATAALPWAIVPQDEEDPEQMYAAECIEDLIRSNFPNTPDFHRNLLDSIWFGRMGATIEYAWDFSTGVRRMKPVGWMPVHGDTIVFGTKGSIGYKVGVPFGPDARKLSAAVIGQYIPVGEEPLKDGAVYLEPCERKAWVVHHHQKTAGEYRLFTSAAAMYGLGLRSRIYPIWLLKQSAMSYYMQAAEKFGAGYIIGYFDGGNPASANAVRAALQKQVGSCVQMFPRFGPESEAIEGMEVIDPPSQGFQAMLDIINYYDKQIRMTICSESMTADNEGSSGGIGSNLAEIQQSTFGRLIKYDSAALGETLTDQFVNVLQEFNGFAHLPKLRFEFSYDIGTTKDKIENAEKLVAMGVRLDLTELAQEAGFTPLKDAPIVTQVTEGGETIDTTGLLPGEDDEEPESDDAGVEELNAND